MDDKQEITDQELHEMFNEHLDDAYGPISIAGLEYATSDALKSMDPIAYRCSFNDWLDWEISGGYLEEIDGKYYLPE